MKRNKIISIQTFYFFHLFPGLHLVFTKPNYMCEQSTIQKKQIKSNPDVIFSNNLNYSKNILNLDGIAFHLLSKENKD